MPNPDRAFIWLKRLHAAEDSVLQGLLLGSLGLALLQIVLRLFFHSGLDWIGPLLRVLMLWLGLWAGMIAAREGRHITMDALGHYLNLQWKRRLRRVTDIFAMLVCALLTWSGWQMMQMSREFADTGPLGWPVWWFQSVLPLAFAVMAVRYLLHALLGWSEGEPPAGLELRP